jgi:signal transduction histidine kinase
MERNGEIKGLESFWKKPDGTLIYVRENARAIPDPHGALLYYEGTVEDVTEQKQAERQIRTLTQQLIRAQESERQLISRELHDRFAQELSTAKILCDMLLSEQLPEVGEKAAEISGILQGAIEGIRDLSYDLRPASLDQLGLAQTILQYCEGFSDKSGIHVDFFSAGIEHLALDADTGINLYRLVQEGLNNIRNHAAATHATVKLVASSPNIILRIEDNGRGFDVKKRLNAAREEKRMGLQSMQERVGLLQGKMGIQSIPGKGTRILMEIPIKEKKGAGEEDRTNR